MCLWCPKSRCAGSAVAVGGIVKLAYERVTEKGGMTWEMAHALTRRRTAIRKAARLESMVDLLVVVSRPNGMGLSCAAELKRPQMEFYHRRRAASASAAC
jgi:hypothetical protein